jgi:tetratricopeptide (TPR) repeat protein
MTNKKMVWAPLPGKHKEFDYDLSTLHKAWSKLHVGDGEEYPDQKRAEQLIKAAGKFAPKGMNASILAEQLQSAWLAFHRGEFQKAFEIGSELGPCGTSVAAKAIGIHATYLVKKPAEQMERYKLLVEIAEQAIDALPKEANSHYRLAYGLGRYSQSISIAKALSMGLAGKVKKALDMCLKLNPKHAEAHLASALWHAEIINKVGSTLGSFTYGAKQKLAEEHIKTALKLAPNMPIVHAEHAQMLLLLDEDNEQEAADAFERASELKPLDAMDFLDGRFAKDQIS